MRIARLLLSVCSVALADQSTSSSGPQTLHIALHDGFTGQTVSIAVDHREVYRRSGVRTDLRISRADAVDTEAAGPEITVEVTVDPGDQRAVMRVDICATPYLAIDLKSGAIHLTLSGEPFHYM
jgi:hypothetical protein